jgi:hypothetical protein
MVDVVTVVTYKLGKNKDSAKNIPDNQLKYKLIQNKFSIF